MIYLFDFDYHFVNRYNHLHDVLDDQDDHVLIKYYYVEDYYSFDDDYYNENYPMDLNTDMDDIDLNNHVDQHSSIQIDRNQLEMD